MTLKSQDIHNESSVIHSFLVTGVLWLFLLLGLSLVAESRPIPALQWATGFWAICLLGLFALAKALASILALVAEKNESTRAPLIVQALFWGAIKLGSLGLIGYLLVQAQQAPKRALVLGLGTLVVVPLVTGFRWSQKELNHA